tara:strand:- start:7227 stop:8072 length:846 start_codon:yes stop_codon:yes gene_type:complete
MAKKTKKDSYQGDPGDEHAEKVVVEQPKVKIPVMEKPKPKKDTWEIRDRVYTLKNGRSPLSKSIKSANIYYFDEEKGYEREIKYCENQRTAFVDEMKGDQRLSHIIFRSGQLYVPKNKVMLQKFLSLYHPHRDKVYEEQNLVKRADTQLDWLEFEIAALNAAKNLDVKVSEAVMRVELGSRVSELSSSELKRDLLIFAKRNPKLFLELVTDENIQLRNVAVKACEAGIIELSQDQRTFSWKSTGRKLMSVPFEVNPYSALASWFKTDEGVEVYSQVELRLK